MSAWGQSNYVNPPFGVVIHKGKKKGATAWARKAVEQFKQGKRVVMVYPIDKWVLMLLDAGAKVRNLKDVKWCATEDGTAGKGTGRHIACFVLDPKERSTTIEDCIRPHIHAIACCYGKDSLEPIIEQIAEDIKNLKG